MKAIFSRILDNANRGAAIVFLFYTGDRLFETKQEFGKTLA